MESLARAIGVVVILAPQITAAATDCVSLAAALRSSSVVVKSQGEFENDARAYCSAAYSTSGSGDSSGVKVGYGPFSLGASGSQSRYSSSYNSLCASSSTLRDASASYREYVQAFDVHAYPVIDHCMTMSKRNVTFDVQQGGITETTLTFSVIQATTSNTITEVTFQASPGVACRYSRRGGFFNADNVVTLRDNDTVTALCTRPVANRRDLINVSLRSSDPPLVIPWSAYKDGLPIDAYQSAQRAQTDFEVLRASLIGSVVAFNRTTCPNGWKEYELARGRFVRGIDKQGGTTDPDGQRAPGTTQEDAFASHDHAIPAQGLEADSGRGFEGTGFDSNSAKPTTRRTTAEAGSGKETRPKNVALLYCVLQ